MIVETGIYTGTVRHARVKPRRLSLRHRCFWLAVDIDRLDTLARSLPIFSHNRFNILSFYDRDHGAFGEGSIRQKVDHVLAEAGCAASCKRVVLLCMPRVLGYGFNPISLYFCLDGDDQVSTIIYEVHNTFNQRHAYIAPVTKGVNRIEQSAEKAFYVSPFMDMDLSYAFKLDLDEGQLLLSINANDHDGAVIRTSLKANHRTLTPGSLFKAWICHPLMSFKVIAAIHIHAARLWCKGLQIRTRPSPPSANATLGKRTLTANE